MALHLSALRFPALGLGLAAAGYAATRSYARPSPYLLCQSPLAPLSTSNSYYYSPNWAYSRNSMDAPKAAQSKANSTVYRQISTGSILGERGADEIKQTKHCSLICCFYFQLGCQRILMSAPPVCCLDATGAKHIVLYTLF